jgi:GH25 family lysozyme M1 (1,4-beta-N-acetylmuramidase)
MDVSHLAIDVSLWDGYDIRGNIVPIDWKQTGYPIALIKSSQRNYADPVFKKQWESAKGIPRVAYHFFDASYNAIQQANDCWNIIKADFTDTDYLAIDFETFVA